MNRKYLIHYVHEHVNFKWVEFKALASKHNCNYSLSYDIQEFNDNPYIVVETDNLNPLMRLVKDSFLIKGLLELWGSGDTLEQLSDEIIRSSNYDNLLTLYGHQTFKVNVESFRAKVSQPNKVLFIETMTFLNDFTSRPDLRNPQQVYNILLHKEHGYYFGRYLTDGNRDLIYKLNLKDRKFIANTSMDPQLSLICANAARTKLNDLIYDPFVGSGSLLIGAAHLGAFVMGGDIDWALLHGRSKPSRKSDRVRQEGENIRANFMQYNILNRYLDVTVSEISKPPIVDRLRFDAIISDPPYGIREGCEKVGSDRKETKPIREGSYIRYPPKKTCDLRDLLAELLNLSAKHLTVGGRLVYFLPIPNNQSTQSLIPRHPCLKLAGYCDQPLTYKTSRSMIVMEKVREPEIDDFVSIPEANDSNKFRELYFSQGPRKLDERSSG